MLQGKEQPGLSARRVTCLTAIIVVIAVLSLLVVRGVENKEPNRLEENPSVASPTASEPTKRPLTASEFPAKLVQRRITDRLAGTLAVRRSPFARVTNPNEAAGAPSLLAQPPKAALIVLRKSLFGQGPGPLPYGELAILGDDLSWRTLSPSDLKLRVRNSEVSFALSDDGSRLAVGDQGAILAIDIPSGSFERFSVPLIEPIALTWASDNSRVLASDRLQRNGERSLLLDVRSGRSTRVSFRASRADYGPGGYPIELILGDRNQLDYFRKQIPTGSTSRTPIRVRNLDARSLAVGTVAAFVNQPRRMSRHRAAGVMIFNHLNGEPLALLPLEQLSWTVPAGWLNKTTVLIVCSSTSGYLLSWNYASNQSRLITNLRGGPWEMEVAVDLISR